MLKLYHFGIPSQPQKDKYYFDIAINDETKQTGSIRKLNGNLWQMYLSNMYVRKEFQNEIGKHYANGSFMHCINEAERLLGTELLIVAKCSFLEEMKSFL